MPGCSHHSLTWSILYSVPIEFLSICSEGQVKSYLIHEAFLNLVHDIGIMNLFSAYSSYFALKLFLNLIQL
jgi:hypothetical protein